jgi:myxalamid-type polyketide synthase MxaE and MxaD
VSQGTEDSAGLTPLRRALLALQQMQAKLDLVEGREKEPIAVIGLACRFPGGANDAHSYWRLLRDGVDAVVEVPADRWDKDAYYDENPGAPGKMVTRWGGFLSEVREFDPAFFSISPREAASMDPQQRLLLELSAEAFQHAGQTPERLVGSKTGVFVGVSTHDYSELQMTSGGIESTDAYSGTGNAFSVASGRISYVFGLEGPSIALDTACSSSLVAVHLACQSLRLGESSMAIAGGASLMLSPLSSVAMSKLGALSFDGRCRTFDAAASGYVRAEGAGVVLLKRLRDAERDRDRIWAVVRGSAVNQDGRSGGLTVPNGPAQQAVIRAALAGAGIDPKLVSYIEAHGTATPLGDPIEVEAMCKVLGPGRGADRPLFVGSVKTNFGHAESAAGVAGLIKVILSLRHGQIPAHLHFRRLNPHIVIGEVPLRFPQHTVPWTPVEGRRIAGVSAFGFSGTNAHVVIEEAPPSQAAAPGDARPAVLPLSARDEGSLRELAARTALAFESEEADLLDTVYTAWQRREHHRQRLAARSDPIAPHSHARSPHTVRSSPRRGS